MTATLTNEDIKVFNVSNKFGFLNISDDSEDEVIKPRKNVRKNNMNKKKQHQQPSSKATSNIVGLTSAPSSNIINPANQGLSKSAKKRLRKKKKAEEAAEKTEEPKIVALETPLTPDELLEQELQHVIRISLEESANGAAAKEDANDGCDNKEEEKLEEEVEEADEDLFLPVIEGIKTVMKQIMKDDEIPIIDIPLENSQMLRKRALQLQDINSEFKNQLNGLLKVGYKYKKRYQKEKTKNAELRRMLSKCKGGGNKVDLLKQILENEDTIASVTKQVEELSEELEKERTRAHALQGARKNSKKVSFSDDK